MRRRFNWQGVLDSLKHLKAETSTEVEALLPALPAHAFKGDL